MTQDRTISQRGDGYSCLVDDDLRNFDTVREIIGALNSAVTASITLERNQTTIRVERNVTTGRDPPDLTNIHVRAWESEFRPPRNGWNGRTREQATEAYLDAVRTAVESTRPRYGYGRYHEYTKPNAIPTYDDVVDGRVRGIFWLNVFGETNIDRIGRAQIESAPAWVIDELTSGHLLVVASDNSAEPSKEWETVVDSRASRFEIDRG